MSRAPTTPKEKTETVRSALLRELRAGLVVTAEELSAAVHARERDVLSELEHLARTLRAQGERLVVTPAECIGCGFVFRSRERYTAPGQCPQCRASRINPPAFSVATPGARG
ncbi:MAG: transcriptional regulator [Deltaproteobacteria bacterium]|nr:transcriptional regulator [Deltaproteobacteria bacterium]